MTKKGKATDRYRAKYGQPMILHRLLAVSDRQEETGWISFKKSKNARSWTGLRIIFQTWKRILRKTKKRTCIKNGLTQHTNGYLTSCRSYCGRMYGTGKICAVFWRILPQNARRVISGRGWRSDIRFAGTWIWNIGRLRKRMHFGIECYRYLTKQKMRNR